MPSIESIQSFLPLVDELVVVDGGSNDGTIDQIKGLKSDKIKLVNDKDTFWSYEWKYDIMGRNFQRGFDECTGDWVIKFDSDYILHEAYVTKTRQGLEYCDKNNFLFAIQNRLNFILIDRYFQKTWGLFAVNKTKLIKEHPTARMGCDLKQTAINWEFVEKGEWQDGIYIGDLFRTSENSYKVSTQLWNYDHAFMTKERLMERRLRHFEAEIKQFGLHIYGIDSYEKEYPYELYLNICKRYFKKFPMTPIEISHHPIYIQDRIKQMNRQQFGYSGFDLIQGEKSAYLI